MKINEDIAEVTETGYRTMYTPDSSYTYVINGLSVSIYFKSDCYPQCNHSEEKVFTSSEKLNRFIADELEDASVNYNLCSM